MSFPATQWLSFLKAPVNASEHRLLFILADMANDMWRCWPSRAYLAQKMGLGIRQVVRILGRLVAKGLLTIAPRKRWNGSQSSNMYELRMETNGAKCHPSEPVHPSSLRSEGDIFTDDSYKISEVVTSPVHKLESEARARGENDETAAVDGSLGRNHNSPSDDDSRRERRDTVPEMRRGFPLVRSPEREAGRGLLQSELHLPHTEKLRRKSSADRAAFVDAVLRRAGLRPMAVCGEVA